MAEEAQTRTAPYVRWATFLGALERLSEGPPNIVDRTALVGLAWNVQTQLLAALKFFELIDEEGVPLPQLSLSVGDDEAARKKHLSLLFQKYYSPLFALDLTKTTPMQLRNTMSEVYGVNGDTLDKAQRFFLTGLDYLGIPVSTFLARSRGTGTTSTGPKKRRTPRPQPVPPPTVTYPLPSEAGDQRVVRLASGGALTLVSQLNYLKLSSTDRKFLSTITDLLDQYEMDNMPPSDDED